MIIHCPRHTAPAILQSGRPISILAPKSSYLATLFTHPHQCVQGVNLFLLVAFRYGVSVGSPSHRSRCCADWQVQSLFGILTAPPALSHESSGQFPRNSSGKGSVTIPLLIICQLPCRNVPVKIVFQLIDSTYSKLAWRSFRYAWTLQNAVSG